MTLYDFTAMNKHGETKALSDYEGKVVLVLNSATQCGFTPQYDILQNLYDTYVEDGFVILDFPCNQFGNQAPGTDDEIYSFCDSNYGVKFPIFSKVEVNGENAHPLFKYLVKEKGFAGFDEGHRLTPVLDKKLSAIDPEYKKDPSIKWNFTKFLFDRTGNLVERFEPTKDMSVVEERIKGLL